jgi:chaperone required for assembly of F1-ATPase
MLLIRCGLQETMRRFTGRFLSSAAAATMSARGCSTASGSSLGAAPKKKRTNAAAAIKSGTQAAAQAAAATPEMDPSASAKLSTDRLAEQIERIQGMDSLSLEKMQKAFNEENAENKLLEEDSLYQLDVSLTMRQQGGQKVFWKDVDVVAAAGRGAGWYSVAVDGRRVKAFELPTALAVPSEEFALAIAEEYGTQRAVLNKLTMPLTDLASGAQHVPPQGITGRVDYLMSFFANDNLYFRAEAIAAEQDALIAPAAQWFERVFDIHTPRIVGLGHPSFSIADREKVRQQLNDMQLNQYQIVALCVVAQFTASLMLPLALFHRVITLEAALRINKAEEGHNITEHGEIKGYHDIREADVVVKIAASAAAWRMTEGVSLERCSEMSAAAEELMRQKQKAQDGEE